MINYLLTHSFSYIVAYNWGNKERWQIYLWQGLNASIADKGTGAGQVIDVNAKMCQNTATQVRRNLNKNINIKEG